MHAQCYHRIFSMNHRIRRGRKDLFGWEDTGRQRKRNMINKKMCYYLTLNTPTPIHIKGYSEYEKFSAGALLFQIKF